MMNSPTVETILGGKKTINIKIQNQMDYVELSNKGVSKEALLHVADYWRLSMRQLAPVLSVTERTIQRYKPKKLFSRPVSERILQLAELAARGTDVLGSQDNFLEWMNTQILALGNKKPIDLINSKYGIDMVLDELGRIEHGIIA